MPILHGNPASPFVRKVQAVLNIKEVKYELNPLIPFDKTEEFMAISPLGKIPVYQDGDFILNDSSAICAYLEKKHTNNPVYPENAEDYAKVLWLEEYADTQLFQATFPVFFQRVLNPNLFEAPTDEVVVSQALNDDLPAALNYLEALLGSNNYLVGNTLSFADFAIAGPFVNIQFTGYSVDETQWPKVSAFLTRVSAHPAFISVIEM